MIRKKGKLPGPCMSTGFDKEYEAGDVFEIQSGALKPHSRIVIVDDILATGGSVRAASRLVSEFKPESIKCICLMDLGLTGVDKDLEARGIHVNSLFDVSNW